MIKNGLLAVKRDCRYFTQDSFSQFRRDFLCSTLSLALGRNDVDFEGDSPCVIPQARPDMYVFLVDIVKKYYRQMYKTVLIHSFTF